MLAGYRPDYVLDSVKKSQKKKTSAALFRSEDIRVMSPARFHCATALLE